MDDYNELRRLAFRAAPQFSITKESKEIRISSDDLDYFAAANPAAIIKLLGRLEAADRLAEAVREDVDAVQPLLRSTEAALEEYEKLRT